MAWHCGNTGCPTHSSPEHRCRNYRLSPLSDSVGEGGTNREDDVRVIQGALNQGVWSTLRSHHAAFRISAV